MSVIDLTSALDEREPDAGIEYRCARCRGIFPYLMTEAEAEAIYDRDFPGQSRERRVEVCPGCYDKTRELHRWL